MKSIRTLRVALLLPFFLLPAIAHARSVGRFRHIRPFVEARPAATENWTRVQERFSLQPGQYVRSGPSGGATLIFSNGNEVVLNSKAQLVIEGENTEAKPLSLRVFGALAQMVVRSKGSMPIRAAAATAAPQGTEYMISLPDENTMVVTVAEGSVRLFNEQGSQTIGVNQQSTAKVGQAPSAPIAVDASGLMQWAFDIAGLPVEFEMPGVAGADINTLEAAVAANANDGAAWAALGEAKRQTDDANGAVTAYAKALQLAPTENSRIGLALSLLARNDVTGARDALAVAPNGALTLAARGLVQLRANDVEAAVQSLTAAANLDPKLPQAPALLALANLTRNKTADAVAAARRAVVLAPASSQAQSALALALFYSGQPREATRAANLAVKLNPSSPLALLAQGQALLAQHQTDAARAAFMQAEALAPRLPLVQTNLGAAYARLDMPLRAAKAYRHALEVAPNSAAAHTGLGSVLLATNHPQDALTELRRALELEPKNPAAKANIAAYYVEMGDFKQAESELKEIGDDPSAGAAYVRLSEASLFQQKLLPAQQYARKAVKLLPDSAPAHYQLGRVYREMERTVQSEQEFRQAVILDPHFAEARFALGLARELAESGGDFNRPLSAISSNSSGPRQALNIQNLQTPGVEDRIQAAIQDPSVVRSASRAFGDDQIEGRIGEDDTNSFSLSHLQDINDRRGSFGAGLSRDHTDGIRDNADLTEEKAGFTWGAKEPDTPSAFFALAQWNRRRYGDDVGLLPAPPDGSSRADIKLPNLIVGYNQQTTAKQRTRMLLQFDQPRSNIAALDASSHVNVDGRSAHAEIRHDTMIGQHLISFGASTGRRQFDQLIDTDIPGFQFRQLTINRLKPSQIYIRDDFTLNKRLSVSGEMKVVRLGDHRTFDILASSIPFPPTPPIDRTLTRGVPNFVLNYKPNAASLFRFRARRVFNPVVDFGLLSPNDEFLFSAGDEILPRVDGGGRSLELEYTHTFNNASFLRCGLFQQNLKNINGLGIENFLDAHLQGLRARYEGILNRQTTYFLNGNWSDTSATLDQSIFGLPVLPNYELSLVPRLSGEIGVQFLSKKGWFLQPSLAYSGSRRLPFDAFSGAPRTRLGGFAVTNFRIGKRSGLRSSIFVEVANIFDKAYVTPGLNLNGDLQAGRQIRVGSALRF